jgi:TRAP-type C4-dicarboxylate transport system permease small subunit
MIKEGEMLKRVVTIISYVGAGSVACIAFLTGADVTGRYALNKPVLGTIDLIELLMAIAIASGIAVTTALDDHISVDSLFQNLPSRGQHLLLLFAGIVCTFIFALSTWQGIQGGIDVIKSGKATYILEIPLFPFKFLFTFGFFFSLIFSIHQTILLLRNKKSD